MTGYTIEFEGGSYDPSGKVDKVAANHNAEISRAEVEWFKLEKPSRHFAYVARDLSAVTTWTGEKLGTIVWYGQPYKMPAIGFPSTRQNLRIEAINGLTYSAVYYKSSGDYCRMKVISSSKRSRANG